MNFGQSSLLHFDSVTLQQVVLRLVGHVPVSPHLPYYALSLPFIVLAHRKLGSCCILQALLFMRKALLKWKFFETQALMFLRFSQSSPFSQMDGFPLSYSYIARTQAVLVSLCKGGVAYQCQGGKVLTSA
ncbi:hypothetical protein SAY86_010948 [Trapa natans]|uniref:Uncharacterized protein n=1 Tax=Trapa natans TaxID=22666 RepID=A0AAN7R3S1_TRANT|nr:hypothetical protein SAY86_010948 [Trapa natans]